jgi:hypothetical protein
MQPITKESLIKKFEEITAQGWIVSGRQGNQGGVGNTLEDLLGITENNLPIPNAAEWELKAQQIDGAGRTSYTTLLHKEPTPQSLRLVGQLLLPKYGWKHQEAGGKYSDQEMSFRQTINGVATTDRGFMIKLDENDKKITVSFDASKVSERHAEWLKSVEDRVGLGELNPQPYWGYKDLEHLIGTKLHNCFYAQARMKKENGLTYFKYERVLMLQNFDFGGFISAILTGEVLIDFDARTGHNHGTKFRLKSNFLPQLYEKSTVVAEASPLEG